MAKKYLKNSKGYVMAIATDNLQLEKPLANEHYNIEVHNRNMEKIDGAIQGALGDISTDKSDISSLQTQVNNGQTVKMTEDNGACRGIPNNNANDINITGFWMGENVINAPQGITNTWIYIESLVHNGLHQVQKATDLHDSSKRWTRHKTSGQWSEWREL